MSKNARHFSSLHIWAVEFNRVSLNWRATKAVEQHLFSVVKTPTIVYNLKMIGNGAWQKNFSPDSVVASSHVGSIVGGVLGGLALISGVVLGFIVYRRRKRAGAEKHSLPKGGGGVGYESSSDNSITLNNEGGRGRGSSTHIHVFHTPVTTDISPMAPPDTNRQPTQPSATLCLAVIPRPNSTIPSVLLQTPMTQYTTQDTPLQHSKSMTLWSVLKDT